MWRQPKQVQWGKDQYNEFNQSESILDNTLVETINDYNVIMDSCRYGVFIVNFEHISYLFVVFLLLTVDKEMFDGRGRKYSD